MEVENKKKHHGRDEANLCKPEPETKLEINQDQGDGERSYIEDAKEQRITNLRIGTLQENYFSDSTDPAQYTKEGEGKEGNEKHNSQIVFMIYMESTQIEERDFGVELLNQET